MIDKLGRNLNGVVVACLRKVQQWALVSVFEEYRRFSGLSRLQQQHEQFVEVPRPPIHSYLYFVYTYIYTYMRRPTNVSIYTYIFVSMYISLDLPTYRPTYLSIQCIYTIYVSSYILLCLTTQLTIYCYPFTAFPSQSIYLHFHLSRYRSNYSISMNKLISYSHADI